MPAHDLAETLLERGHGQRALQENGVRNVVSSTAGLELIEKEQPSLRERERKEFAIAPGVARRDLPVDSFTLYC